MISYALRWHYIRMMLNSKINKETSMIPMTTKELLTQGAGKSKRSKKIKLRFKDD